MKVTCAIVAGLFVFASVCIAAEIRHPGTEDYSFGITGDAGVWNKNTQDLVAALTSTRIKQLILPGDNLYHSNETYEHVWGPWKNKGLEFSIVAIGNHNISYQKEIQYFRMPGEFFSVVYGTDARFIVLNSDNTKNVTEQMDFLEDELNSAKERFIFLVYHHPTYTLSLMHSWKEKQEFQLAMREKLSRFKGRITALIVGHDHEASLVTLDDLPMIISGASQETRAERPVNYKEDGVEVRTNWLYKKHPHFARLDFRGSREDVWITFVDAKTNQISCSAKIFPRPVVMNQVCSKTTVR